MATCELPAGDLAALPRRELQALAKACGLKANAKSEELTAQLAALRVTAAGGEEAPMDEAEAEEDDAMAADGEAAAAAAAAAEEEEEDAIPDVADITRRLENDFASAAAPEVESPVMGLVAPERGGRRRGGGRGGERRHREHPRGAGALARDARGGLAGVAAGHRQGAARADGARHPGHERRRGANQAAD